uniref:SANT domain-containing protein n=1 Tax=Caenorhabditis japonica TaxID=281687 RepID=A0A8R1HXL1_CAEJA
MEPSTSDESSTSSNSALSRRKMIFRQPMPVQPNRTVSSTMCEESQMIDGEITNLDSPSPNLDAKKRKANPWSFDEVCAFYEGIKIHGKDFDSVVKVMAKRKVEKTKEHVKTFFFNSAKTYRTMLSLSEEEMTLVSKDARELFLLVNACEWKRKTMNMKVNVEKLRELLFEGAVNVRVGRKIVNIKTPPCPALCRYFSGRKADKIPTEMFVHLEPMRNEDNVFMRNHMYNPFLRIKMNANDRIMKLVEFLHRKWSANTEAGVVNITLWPDSSCEVASLTVHTVETSPFISLSLGKLKRHLEEAKERIESKEKKGPGSLQTAAEVNTKTKSTYDVYYPRAFTLTDEIIAEGIHVLNIKNSILAELFCVCGRKSPIQLRYQIHYEPTINEKPTVEPWKVMIELLNRGYGDTLNISKKEEERDRRREAKEAEAALEPNSKKKKLGDNTPSVDPCSSNTAVDIVQQENDAFENQLAMLKKTSRQRTVPAKRKKPKNPVISTNTPPISIRPVTSPTPSTTSSHGFAKPFTAPSCVLIPKKITGQNPVRVIGRDSLVKAGPSISEAQQMSNLPTDFSSVVFSPAKRMMTDGDLELQKKRTEDFLSSLRTPVDTPKQTPRCLPNSMAYKPFSMANSPSYI